MERLMPPRQGVIEINGCFLREVLPLEPGLTRFLRRRWRDANEIADLRQETYARLWDAARNLIVDPARRAPAVPKIFDIDIRRLY
jgi:DNA-directed RNA polymerase specialized sigma24 family protein